MAQNATEPAECPTCRRSLLRAVVERARAALADDGPEPERAEFLVCPACGWNNLPERWEQSKLR